MMRWLVLAALLGTPALAEPQRVVSLGGAVTEIVVALGAQGDLIGRDTTSEYPASVTALPDVGYVRALNPEGVMALGPDLILAEDNAGPPEAITVLRAAGIPFVQLPDPHTPEGVVEKIARVGEALGRKAEADRLAADFRARMAAIPAREGPPKRVLFILSTQGGKVMAGGEGTSAEAIIRLAGAESVATGFKGYKPMTDEAILNAAPDVILMMDREGALDDVLAQPALASTPAAKAGAVVRMNGMLLLGFGPRLPEAVEQLNAALYGG
ncbi:heme/hemin ABC transporter substrate-binding protein [Paenirhodobacter sp.]|uniref:heme/hemin ABC transporter substrate-binding protein n=1 Tax=Paenirhodobacter sp. TaxID=1965326 RepID=UPI003B40A286